MVNTIANKLKNTGLLLFNVRNNILFFVIHKDALVYLPSSFIDFFQCFCDSLAPKNGVAWVDRNIEVILNNDIHCQNQLARKGGL